MLAPDMRYIWKKLFPVRPEACISHAWKSAKFLIWDILFSFLINIKILVRYSDYLHFPANFYSILTPSQPPWSSFSGLLEMWLWAWSAKNSHWINISLNFQAVTIFQLTQERSLRGNLLWCRWFSWRWNFLGKIKNSWSLLDLLCASGDPCLNICQLLFYYPNWGYLSR